MVDAGTVSIRGAMLSQRHPPPTAAAVPARTTTSAPAGRPDMVDVGTVSIRGAMLSQRKRINAIRAARRMRNARVEFRRALGVDAPGVTEASAVPNEGESNE